MPLERIELAVVGGFGDGQRRAQRPQRVVAARPAVVEGGADEVELLLEAADADAEDEPAVADLVQRAVALGDLERVVIGEHQHVGGQPDPLGAGGQVAERGQRIPVAGPAAVPLGRGQGDVLAAGEVVVAEPVCGLGDLGQVLDRRRAFSQSPLRPGNMVTTGVATDSFARPVLIPACTLRRRRGSIAR